MKKSNFIKCDIKLRNQCVSAYGSYACKLRFFNGRCLMALKNKQKESVQNERK